MNKALSLTICIPSYNRAKDAIITTKSILDQINAYYLDVNLIIIDNGSKTPYLNLFKSDKIISDSILSGKVFLHRNSLYLL